MPFFKRKKKEKKVVEISPPLPVRDHPASVPTESIGTQAQFSPPSTLQNSAEYSLVEDAGYSVVQDALPRRVVPSSKKSKSHKPNHGLSDHNMPQSLQLSNTSLASVTPINSSQSEDSDLPELNEGNHTSHEARQDAHNKRSSSVYAVVNKTAKTISFSDKTHTRQTKKSSQKSAEVPGSSKTKHKKKSQLQDKDKDNSTHHGGTQLSEAKYDDMDEEAIDYSSDELEGTLPTTLPSHRPPHGSLSPDKSRPSPTQSTPLSLNSLPVYTLNNSTSSNDQSYILSKTRPDGSVEYFTATPVSPTYPIDTLSTSPPRIPPQYPSAHPPQQQQLPSLQPIAMQPGATSTPIKAADQLVSMPQTQKLSAHGLLHSPDASLSTVQQPSPPIQHCPGLYNMSKGDAHSSSSPVMQPKHSKVSFFDSAEMTPKQSGEIDDLHKELQVIKSQRAQLETENISLRKLHDSIHEKAGKKAEEHKKELNVLIHENELLKESIAKLSSEISTHSLVDLQDDNDAELSVEQLLESVPTRLRSVMTAFNETIVEKENLIKSYELELSQLKRVSECTRSDKIKMEKSFSKEKELNEIERQALHRNLSETREQNTSFQNRIASLHEQIKQIKKDHKRKIENLTEELAAIKSERDAVRCELKSLQHHSQELDTILRSYKSERAEKSISVDEHIQTIKDFEDLLEEVKYGAKFNKQIEVKTLERENHSLVEELAELRGAFTALNKECSYLKGINKSYEKWISKLMVDVRASHDREVHITEQLKSSFNDSFSISPKQRRLKTAMEIAKREFEIEEISKKLENYKAHLALQKIRTSKKLYHDKKKRS